MAEGIETRRDLATLIELGVELGQGYLIGRPEADPIVPRRSAVLALAHVGEPIRMPAVGGPESEFEAAAGAE